MKPALCKIRPNMGMQRTALCAHKIGAFVKVGIGSKRIPIYRCAAANAQTVGRNLLHPFRIDGSV